MILRRYSRAVSHASYLVGNLKSQVAAAVDPRRNADLHLAEAARPGWARTSRAP
jgi:hypothetical protein